MTTHESNMKALREALELMKDGGDGPPLITRDEYDHVMSVLGRCCPHHDLKYIAHVAAPGYGVSWECEACGTPMWSAGCGSEAMPYAEMDSPPELSIWDVM